MAVSTSQFIITAFSRNLELIRLSFIIEKHSLLLSTNTALLARLLKASIPKLPVPAYKSKTSASSKCSTIILNRDSFTLSNVGLVEFPFKVFNLCPLAIPEIMRKINIPPNEFHFKYFVLYCYFISEFVNVNLLI